MENQEQQQAQDQGAHGRVQQHPVQAVAEEVGQQVVQLELLQHGLHHLVVGLDLLQIGSLWQLNLLGRRLTPGIAGQPVAQGVSAMGQNGHRAHHRQPQCLGQRFGVNVQAALGRHV